MLNVFSCTERQANWGHHSRLKKKQKNLNERKKKANTKYIIRLPSKMNVTPS